MAKQPGSWTNGLGFKIGIPLAMLFVILKVAQVIDWAWWWVLAPVWVPFILAVLVIFLFDDTPPE